MKTKENITSYPVPKGTTHLMMWIGSKLPEKRSAYHHRYEPYKYQVGNKDGCLVYVNYVETLRKECKEMAKKGESCIFVYDSKILKNKEDANYMKKIVAEIPNCYIVDYEDFVKTIKTGEDTEFSVCTSKDWDTILDPNDKTLDPKDITTLTTKQSDFIKEIDAMIEENGKDQKFTDNLKRGIIGDLVDCMRMLLLLHPKKLKQLAVQKNENKKDNLIKQSDDDYCLLYHDFDIIQVPEKENLSNKEQQNGGLKDNYLTACATTKFVLSGFENGILFANSKNDRNEIIEQLITYYNRYYTSAMYDIMYKFKKIKVNNYLGLDDENHRSWQQNVKLNENKKDGNNKIINESEDKKSEEKKINNQKPNNNKKKLIISYTENKSNYKDKPKKEKKINNQKPNNNKKNKNSKITEIDKKNNIIMKNSKKQSIDNQQPATNSKNTKRTNEESVCCNIF